MLKSSAAVVFLIFTINSFAQDNSSKHMVMFGNEFNAEWNGSTGSYDIDSDSAIKDYDITEGNFSLNYAYTVAPQFQLGLHLNSTNDKDEAKARAGGKITEESKSSEIVLFGIFNFSDKLEHSFYFGAGIGLGTTESETKDTTGGTTDKSDSESDATIYHLTFGKRFPLTFMGIQNLNYSPAISYTYMKFDGDLNDSNINSLKTFTLDLVKFDLLF